MNDHAQEDYFINRELSWLEFNQRVLALAKEKTVPLGEQLKFAAIYGSNLDEFFMVRVGSLYDRTLLKEAEKENKTGMTPAQQLSAIMPKVAQLQQNCDKIVERLYEKADELGYEKADFSKMGKKQEHLWKRYFLHEIFPLLSPQIIDRRHPFPFLRNQEMYLGAMLKIKNSSQPSFGLIPISNQFQRIIFISHEGKVIFALVEELIEHFAGLVFGKNAIQSRCLFRVTRNADITADEGMFDHDVDYRAVMSELLRKRRKLAAVRLQASAHAPADIVTFLCQKLVLPAQQVFLQSAPLDLSIGFKLSAKLAQSAHPELFYPARRPMLPPKGFRLARAAEKQDVLLSYPYQSIRPFIQMLNEAANDPDVLSIKMTLYRMAHESKIIEALIAAAENGKEVVAVVELRARFDEQNNIDFSKQLEEAGCTVIYGFESYKVHSKLTLITKKEKGKFRYISQIGTGNYNEKTSEQYTDQDVLLSYPYQSIRPFIQMLNEAANDPDVLSIKMTLYRMAHESKIIEALIAAAENGKEVVAVVELRARFDEQNNIDFSKQLEEAGCTVIYGFESYKVHSKLTLITKKEKGKFRYISQIGTGNYNEKTSEQYTDLSFITSNHEIGEELAAVFHNLAIERLTETANHLLVAPLCFKSVLLQEMDREIQAKREGRSARIIIKCNSISDREIIEKISEASCAGVPVYMIVRGICCIKAGVPGKTENVHVRSIVGRYLEHERVYAFGLWPQTRIYIASGDFLTRNTERRVEVGVKIQDLRIRRELWQMLKLQLADNVNAKEMLPDGTYRKVPRQEGEVLVDSQFGMYDLLKNAWPQSGIPVQKKTISKAAHDKFVQRRKRTSIHKSSTFLSALSHFLNKR